jgi:hypothetical protein
VDGFLHCAWKEAPPPRVGMLTDRGFNTTRRTCRYFDHTTFLSPRYRHAEATLASIPLLSPHAYPTLAGVWSSVGNDGTYADPTIAVAAGTLVATCTDAGPDDGCDPIEARHDSQGRTGGWHSATLDLTKGGAQQPPAVKVSFDTQLTNNGAPPPPPPAPPARPAP